MSKLILPTDAEVAKLEFLNSETIAEELGVSKGTFYMRMSRARGGNGWDFPEPVIAIGQCTVWVRTQEVQAAIDRHRVTS